MKKILFLLCLCSIVLGACDILPTPTDMPDEDVATQELAGAEEPITATPFQLVDIPLGAGYGTQGPWYEVYFTNPESPLAGQRTGGPDARLAAAIDSARLSVDVAAYSLSLDSIRNALINAYKRGVRVRMVMESDNLERSDPQKIKEAGIPVLGDRRQGLMHDKFVVIDNSEVWLGSMNFTDSGCYEDNNNLLRVHSTKVAENYTKEFEEMFDDDKFGPDVVAATPNLRVKVDGMLLDNYFSPDDGVQASLLDLLENAESTVYFMAFSFTSDEIGNLLRAKAENGLAVFGVMEEEQVKSNVGTEFDAFKQAGLNVKLDGNPGQMHHKTMIIDRSIVVTGSYNFTNSAETRNDENVLIIYDRDIARLFLDEFNRVYEQAQK